MNLFYGIFAVFFYILKAKDRRKDDLGSKETVLCQWRSKNEKLDFIKRFRSGHFERLPFVRGNLGIMGCVCVFMFPSMTELHHSLYKPHTTGNSLIRSDKRVPLYASALQSFYGSVNSVDKTNFFARPKQFY